MTSGRASRETANLRSIALMTAGMASIATADALVKFATTAMTPAQIVTAIGFGGAVAFGAAALLRREPLIAPALFSRAIVLRNLGEVVGAFAMVLGLALVPLSLVTVVTQAMPLVVTFGAVLFFGERVGWRSWTALLVGLLGMILIVRPGFAGFTPAVLVPVVGVVALAARDLASRATPSHVSVARMNAWSLASMSAAGLAVAVVLGDPLPGMTPLLAATLVAIVASTGITFYCVAASMRLGDVAVVSPFRYTRLVFGVAYGVLLYGEILDPPTVVGGALVVATGLYTLHRQVVRRRRARA